MTDNSELCASCHKKIVLEDEVMKCNGTCGFYYHTPQCISVAAVDDGTTHQQDKTWKCSACKPHNGKIETLTKESNELQQGVAAEADKEIIIRKEELDICKTRSSQIKSNDEPYYAKDVICEVKYVLAEIESLVISTHQEGIEPVKSNAQKETYEYENTNCEDGFQYEFTRRNETAKTIEITNSSCYDYNTGNTQTSLIDSRSIPNNKSNNKPHNNTKSRSKMHKTPKHSIHTVGKRHLEVVTRSGSKYEKIFVSRFLPNTTSESIENALYRDYGFIVKANKVESRYPHYSSFCLSVSSEHQKELLKPKYWPKGTYVRKFFGEMEYKPVDGKRSEEINKNRVDSNAKNKRQKQNYRSNRNTDKRVKSSQIINQWI